MTREVNQRFPVSNSLSKHSPDIVKIFICDIHLGRERGTDILTEYKDIFDLLAVRNEQRLQQLSEVINMFDEAPGDIEFREEMRSELSRYSLSFDVDDLSAPYQRPTLIVTARQDNVVGYEDAWAILGAYPRATFAVLDRTGHLLEDQDDNLAQLIQEWLVRVYKFRQKID